jgi:hypothetical protein
MEAGLTAGGELVEDRVGEGAQRGDLHECCTLRSAQPAAARRDELLARLELRDNLTLLLQQEIALPQQPLREVSLLENLLRLLAPQRQLGAQPRQRLLQRNKLLVVDLLIDLLVVIDQLLQHHLPRGTHFKLERVIILNRERRAAEFFFAGDNRQGGRGG